MRGYTTAAVEIEDLTDEELLPIVGLINGVQAEGQPRFTPLSIDDYRLSATSPTRVAKRRVVSAPAGNPIALLQTHYSANDSNPHMIRVDISVHPDHRRKGIATSLLNSAVASAKEAGRSMMTGFILSTVPAASAFADHIGAKQTIHFHESVLRMKDLNRALLEQWKSKGQDRAPGYTVKVFEGAYRPEILESMANLYRILERDSPHPEGQEPSEWTADLVDAEMNHYLEIGDSLTAIAIRIDNNELVGMSQLFRRASNPQTWNVTRTMVDPAHRGHALGKWLKAEVNLEALARWPGVTHQETGNAFGNEAMLAINREMGFRPELTMTEVEVHVTDLETALGSHTL